MKGKAIAWQIGIGVVSAVAGAYAVKLLKDKGYL